jgi:serine/threonine-protein kinase
VKTCPTCSTEYADDVLFCAKDGTTLRSAGKSADLVGNVIADRYRIVKKLGEGGMGAVYLGEHVKMGRKSAIKVMTSSMAHDPDAIARFNREAANAARINHANVCAIYDFGETDDGLIYLAMEFIEGKALTDLIEETGALAPQRATRILQQTADALQAAHDLGIVHRDLKPDNIMIAKGRDNADVVKVVDFGIAKAMGGEEGQKVTKTGLVVGTPEYMSPEQLSGDKLDGRSDLYSLALVYYRMLTGTLPFHADSAQETMIKRLTDDPLPLNDAMPGTTFPATLQQVMNKALARMPNDRYASAAQFGKDAMAATSGMPVDAPAPGSPEGATVLMSAAGAQGAATQQIKKTRVSGRAPTPDTPAPRVATVVGEKPKKKMPVLAIVGAVVVIGGGGAAVMMMNKAPTASPPAGNPAASAPVSQDTALKTVGGNTTASQSTVRQPVNQPAGRNTNPGPAVNPPAASPSGAGTPSWVHVAQAKNALDDIFDRFNGDSTPPAVAQASRDTATAYYNAVGITPKDKAWAAYVVANAFAALHNRTEAKSWAQKALDIEPGSRIYQSLLNAMSGQ